MHFSLYKLITLGGIHTQCSKVWIWWCDLAQANIGRLLTCHSPLGYYRSLIHHKQASNYWKKLSVTGELFIPPLSVLRYIPDHMVLQSTIFIIQNLLIFNGRNEIFLLCMTCGLMAGMNKQP